MDIKLIASDWRLWRNIRKIKNESTERIMKKNQKILLAIPIIGMTACLISFILQLTDSDYLSAIVFFLMALYCADNLVNAIKKK